MSGCKANVSHWQAPGRTLQTLLSHSSDYRGREGGMDGGGGMETLGGEGCDNKGDGVMETKDRKGHGKKKTDGGRETKWKEHELEMADESAEKRRKKKTAWWK